MSQATGRNKSSTGFKGVYQVHNKKGFFRAESRASGNRQSIGSNFTTAEEAAEALRLYDEEHGPRLRKEAEERQAKLEAERVERSLTSSKRKKRAIDDCWVEEDLLAEMFEEDADHVKGYGTRGKKKESEETPEIRQLQMKAMRTVAQSEERVNIAEIKAKEQEKRIRELELELNMEKSKRISLETEIAKLKDGTESEKHRTTLVENPNAVRIGDEIRVVPGEYKFLPPTAPAV